MAASLDKVLSITDFLPLEGQVAGHQAGVWTLQNGNVLVKRSLPAEADFYAAAFASPATSAEAPSEQDALRARLSHYLPQYLGTISLPPDKDKVHSTASDIGIVIESLAPKRYFKRASTLDVKLGTQLWDEGQSEEKIARMIKNAEETTIAVSGLRLTGWQTWSAKTQSFVVTSKAYGKAIEASSLLPGLRLFFGLPTASDGPLRIKILREANKAADSATAFEEEDVPHLPASLILPLIKHALLPTLDELIDVTSKLEWRMRGGSLLIVYEGDEQILRAGLDVAVRSSDNLAQHPSLRTGLRSADHLELSTKSALPRHDCPSRPHARLIDARLIDFAHARFAPGQGPDEGVLHGLRTLRDLVAELIDE